MFDKQRESLEASRNFQKVKAHVQSHKMAYTVGASGAGCLLVGGVFGTKFGKKVDVTAVAKNTALVNWNASARVVQETVVQMPARGHRGNVIWCNELKRAFPSQNNAAKELGVQASNISSQLAGRIPHVGGYTFQNLGENLSETLTLSS
jgi:hypothetical protein